MRITNLIWELKGYHKDQQAEKENVFKNQMPVIYTRSNPNCTSTQAVSLWYSL